MMDFDDFEDLTDKKKAQLLQLPLYQTSKMQLERQNTTFMWQLLKQMKDTNQTCLDSKSLLQRIILKTMTELFHFLMFWIVCKRRKSHQKRIMIEIKY